VLQGRRPATGHAAESSASAACARLAYVGAGFRCVAQLDLPSKQSEVFVRSATYANASLLYRGLSTRALEVGPMARRWGSSRVGSVVFSIVLPAVGALVSLPAAAEPRPEWTVVTLALDGSWGVGTADTQGAAIASALRKCNAMSGQRSDCGAEFTAIKSGWTIGFLCGAHRVLAASTQRVAAEQAAEARTIYLAALYGTDLPPCRHIVTVDPEGFVVTKKVASPGVASTLRDAGP
jgi:hypothetical protein